VSERAHGKTEISVLRREGDTAKEKATSAQRGRAQFLPKMRSARCAADAAATRNIGNHINGLLLSPASAYERGRRGAACAPRKLARAANLNLCPSSRD